MKNLFRFEKSAASCLSARIFIYVKKLTIGTQLLTIQHPYHSAANHLASLVHYPPRHSELNLALYLIILHKLD